MIDLRSDTVTKPTAAMREAIARAEVHDDVIDVDPTVAELQARVAELLGKEAALFMPSGTMTNQIAIRIHCQRGDEFICDADAHVYHYEQAGFAQLSGVAVRPVPGERGALRLEQLRDLIRPENDHLVRTRLVVIENTHNRGGGRLQPFDEVERICRWGHDHGLVTHLDGARLWNAAIASGMDERALAEPFDSVSVCLSKGLGTPVGSVLAGTRAFIREARRARKLFGGGMRQAGMLAAAGLHALEHHRARLAEDHAAACRLGEAVGGHRQLSLRGDQIDTNIVIFEVDPGLGTAEQVVEYLRRQQVLCMAISRQAVRMVTHLDVSAEEVGIVCELLAQVDQNQLASPSLAGEPAPG
jgi:threonine aldolase